MFAQSIYSTKNVGSKLLFENHICRCWDFYIDPFKGGGADTVHHHCLDYTHVAPSRLLGIKQRLSLEPNDLLFYSNSEDNQVTWNSIQRMQLRIYHDRPMGEYLIELKYGPLPIPNSICFCLCINWGVTI